MNHSNHFLPFVLVLVALTVFGKTAGGQTGIDLISTFDQSSAPIAGDWRKDESGLVVQPSKAARVVLADNLPDQYKVLVEFTRSAGDDSIGLILPVGQKSPVLEISGWKGEAHGLSRVDGLPAKHANNPTAVRPGRIENGKRQTVTVEVETAGDSTQIEATLNDSPLFSWKGKTGRLDSNLVLTLPQRGTFGLAATDINVVFHRVTLVRDPTSAPVPDGSPKPETTAPGGIDLTALVKPDSPGWEPFNSAQFNLENAGEKIGVKSNPAAGAKDRGAFLIGSRFSEGTIEVDLKGAAQPGGSFVGVVFHGIDGSTYDSVYFRPFNFGHADPVRRGHAVQYMSHPKFPWDQLRADQPEQFENPANPEPGSNEWFRAKIEVKGGRVKVFVDGADAPCLDVRKLGDFKEGKVGLWFNGIASFANLKVTNG